MKTRQRFLSLVLGIVMLCSLVSMASAADDNNLNPYGAYDDTVVVTIGKPAVSSLGFLYPNDTPGKQLHDPPDQGSPEHRSGCAVGIR